MNEMIKIQHLVCILTLFLTTVISNSAQSSNNDKVLAAVGEIKITESEFLERFELTPQFGSHRKRLIDISKLDFLYTLIAEKLWALEAKNENLDQEKSYQTAVNSIEKMFVRDALYRTEILDKINISDEEFIDGKLKYSLDLFINFVFTEQKNDIDKLYNLLESGIPFDTLLSVRPELNEQTEPIKVSFGDMQEYIEDSLYKLKPNNYTSPIDAPEGWYIFYLKDKLAKLNMSQADITEINKKVESIIRKRKESEFYTKFMAEFFKDKKVDADGNLVAALANKTAQIFEDKFKNFNKAESDLIRLEAEDVLNLFDYFGEDELKKPFIKFEVNPITLEQFIRELIFDGFYTEFQSKEQIRYLVDSRIRKYIRMELLAREGLKRGLNFLPEVKHNLKMWQDNYLFSISTNQLQDTVSVSDSLVKNYYNQIYTENKTPTLVNVAEILTDSLEIVNFVLKEVENGTGFKDLARDFNKREWTKPTDGEYGFFPVNLHGEIGRIAAEMNIGEVYGPIKVKEGYSIIKLLDKKEAESLPPSRSFEEVKNDLKTEITNEVIFKDRVMKTVSLANQHGITINYDALKKVEVTNLSSFGIRNLGFGGKITAVPIIAPFSNWVPIWMESQKELP